MTRFQSPLITLAVAAVTLLGGCAIGPDYKRPPVAEPEMFRGQATAEAASLADAPWWELFPRPGAERSDPRSAPQQLRRTGSPPPACRRRGRASSPLDRIFSRH